MVQQQPDSNYVALGQALSGVQAMGAPHVQIPQAGTIAPPGNQPASDPLLAMQILQMLMNMQKQKAATASAPRVMGG